MFVRKTMTFAALSLMSALLIGLFGCGSNSSVGPGSNTTASARAFNALVGPRTATVNFDQRATTSVFEPTVAYGTATSYTTVPAGNGVNNFVTAGVATIASASYNISPNTDYTLVAYGDYTQTNGLAPTISQFNDSIPSASSLGTNAAVRVIHVAPFTNAAYQNIDIYNAGQPLSGSGLTGIAYGNATAYESLPAGTYNITVHSHTNNALLALPTSNTTFSNLTLTAGKAYTIFAIGTDNATFTAADPFNLVLVADD
jgi:hypothetical protein